MSKDAARNYCFTFNNYPSNLAAFNVLLHKYCVYGIYGREVAPTTGTPHLQGYFQLKEKERISGVSKKFPGCHLILAKGGYDANVRYCSKENQTYEMGSPATSGKRLWLDEACKLVIEKRPMSEISVLMPECYVRYCRGLDALSSLHSGQRSWKTEVYWFWGPTGSGKSRKAYELAPSAFWKSPSTKWWNGYDGHEDVIIDDYRRDLCTFAELLRLLDRYPMSIETKGGVKPFLARRLYITTPKSPICTWEGRTEEDLAQLLRRIENVEYIGLEEVVDRSIRLSCNELIKLYQ